LDAPIVSELSDNKPAGEQAKREEARWQMAWLNNKERPAANSTFSGLGKYRDIDAINKINGREHR
jgi:hypothetical protein